MQTFSSPEVEPEESITAATAAAARSRANRHLKSAFCQEAATLITSTLCSLTHSLFSPNFPPPKNTSHLFWGFD